MSLSGKTALITGAAHRIGATIARTLHSQGANIALHYRSSQTGAASLKEELEKDRPGSVSLIQGDLLQFERLTEIIEETVNKWGQLDILINNASTFYTTPIGSVTEQHWIDLIGSNLKAPFFLSQAAAPHLKESNGCIVNIVDIHAERPLKEYPVYSIAKSGLVMMTKALACELGPEVRVNGVAPGAIMWPEHEMDETTKERIISRTFLKRQGDPMDIAKAVRFLVEEAAYTSGQILTVDGGRSLNS